MTQNKPTQEELMLMGLDTIYSKLAQLNEKMECILFTICKSDKKTHDAIRKFIMSDFNNRQKMH